jgi:uncharacterized protein
MKYRVLGNEKVSALGFGCMRLPVIDGDSGKINEPETTRMIHYAIDRGVNYVDTAWGYHNGQSEPATGRALSGGWREKVFLATKLPQWLVKTHEDCDKYLNEQLVRLQTDHIDFYLVHALGKGSWEKMKSLDVGKFLDRAIADGRIRYAGFSFHDDGENFAPIVDGYNWTFCQIQYNYMDEENQQGTKGFKYAVSKGLHIIVMEPLRGGKLAQRIPENIQKLLDESGLNYTTAELALRWVWNIPETATVLSGMSAMEQVVENCQIADRALPNTMTPKELDLVEKVKELYQARVEVACTNCQYCLPCPGGVDIPAVFKMYNDLKIYGDERAARFSYGMFMKDENKADKCTECAECEAKCPQGLEIRDLLKQSHTALTGKS